MGTDPGVGGGTHSLTRKGWLTSCSTDFSLCTCCSCFSRMTSGMLITLSAKKRLAVFSRTSCTRPNVPVPAGGGGGAETPVLRPCAAADAQRCKGGSHPPHGVPPHPRPFKSPVLCFTMNLALQESQTDTHGPEGTR